MQLFVHDESTTSVFRPRHPIVSGLDILGMAVTMFFLSLTAHVAVQSYLISLLLLYFFSMLHHWLSYADWRRKIDHMMIFVVIAMTAMPYWGGLLPFEWAPLGPLMIISIVTIGVTVKLFTFMEKKLSGVLYMAAGLPMVFDFAWSWERIPTPWNTLWMVGIGLYVLQLAIYTFRLCNFRKDLFDYRGVQHVVLVSATTLHSLVAVTIVG